MASLEDKITAFKQVVSRDQRREQLFDQWKNGEITRHQFKEREKQLINKLAKKYVTEQLFPNLLSEPEVRNLKTCRTRPHTEAAVSP
jgi:hypothetical protein